MLAAFVSIAAPTGAAGSEQLPHSGVFDEAQGEPRSMSRADERTQWLIFYLVFTDDVLSRYAPGGAMGARFDLFQHAGFPGAQPDGYAIHIAVREGRIRLTGQVHSERDRARAGCLTRQATGVVEVENALRVSEEESQ